MTFDPTQPQSSEELRRAQQLSLGRTRPPAELRGYQPQRFLGAGAYGEVWLALDQTTGRRVAIKYYTHRGGLDWSLLSSEVEKLVFLAADRYVVQLLDVGWKAEPPYYVMEYMEHGSLEDRLRRTGTLPVDEAAALFQEVAVGLAHAHDKGVLHCDLKPANILLDQDGRPRLADFGQSRLSHEQTPSLGTLFFMAPEQADLEAAPTAGWDVYGLGALLYCMLTGNPPRRTERAVENIQTAKDLGDRLARYRSTIAAAPALQIHRLPGVDASLADILERCLAIDPAQRYPNVQAVLDALDARARWRAWRPLVVLGAVGPALLLLVMGLFASNGFSTAVKKSAQALTDRALASNRFAADYVAQAVASDLERRFRAVEQLANDRDFQRQLREVLDDPELSALRAKLNDPQMSDEAARQELRHWPALAPLRKRLDDLFSSKSLLVSSWFVSDDHGLQLARSPASQTVARNYGWRSYYHGRLRDEPVEWRPGPDDHVKKTQLSAVFASRATNRWAVAVSTPIYAFDGRFLGVVAMTVDVGSIVELKGGHEQFPVLIDWRDGDHRGLILQHPLYDELEAAKGKLPENLKDYELVESELPHQDNRGVKEHYHDKLGQDKLGAEYQGRYLAEMKPVVVRGDDLGWRVIVQQQYETALGETIAGLEHGLFRNGLVAIAVIATVITGLWAVVIRILRGPTTSSRFARPRTAPGPATLEQTLPHTPREREATN